MLSVCIPVFNFDVRPLASQLAGQVKTVNLPVEIIFADDFSEKQYRELNAEVTSHKAVKYIELPANIGRSAIRNKLAQLAKYPYLIYLDSDSELPDSQFLKRYADNIYNAKVICGGTVYLDEKPETVRMLRWVYGRNREQLTSAERQKKGFSITANNFLVAREVMLTHPFRSTIFEYGHEDTVFGYDLHKSGIPILHIDNPVIHAGIETSEQYLEKTGKALANLLKINEDLIMDSEFRNHSPLLKLRTILRRSGLLPIVSWLFGKAKRLLEKNLTGPNPKLWVFDLYKAGFMCSLK